MAAARQAAAAILAVSPELDEIVVLALADSDARANLLGMAASAFQEAPASAAKRFLVYVQAIAPSAEQAVRFAEDCDGNRQLRPSPSFRPLRFIAPLRRVLEMYTTEAKWIVGSRYRYRNRSIRVCRETCT